jgi:hypothetical protein
MNDIFESQAFQEFLQKRCEEILLNDEIYCKLNNSVIDQERDFKKTLSPEQIHMYNCIEKTSLECSKRRDEILYRRGLTDKMV